MKAPLWVAVLLVASSRVALAAGDRADDWKPALVAPSNHFGEWGLVEFHLDGTPPVLLVKGDYNSVAWSPDGTRLACTSAERSNQICVMKVDGSELVQLTQGPTPKYHAAWSPAGTKITFDDANEKNWELFVMDANGKNATNLSKEPRWDGLSSWSPDGKHIAFESDRDGTSCLWIMDANGSNKRSLSAGAGGVGIAPAWSPDGKTIVFGRFANDGTTQLFATAIDGGPLRQLTKLKAVNDYAAWSPDGRYIAYIHYNEWPRDGTQEVRGDLMILDVVEETHMKLSSGTISRWAGSRPAWRPVSQRR